MQIIGVDLHTRQQTIAMLDTETGELVGEDPEARRRDGAGVLFGTDGSGPGRDRSQRIDALVSGADGGTGDRLPGGSSIGDSQSGGTQTETRSAGCGVAAETAGRKALSLDLDAFERTAGSTHTAAAPSSVGAHADASAEHAASHGAQSRSAARPEAVEPSRPTCHRHRCRCRCTPPIDGPSCNTCTDQLQGQIDELDKRVSDQAWQRPGAKLLMTHPGVGPVTALATDVFLGDPARFADGKAVVSYVGMIPREYSSGGRQRLGGLSKQGNPLLRFLWCEAAIHAVRRDPELQRFYRRKLAPEGIG